MAGRGKRIAILGLAVLAAAGGVAAYLRYWQAAPTRGDRLVLYGNVDIRQVDLAFNVDGRIEAMLVEEGDSVTEGQVIARLDDARYRDAVAVAQATLGSYEAVVARLESGSRPEEIARARAEVQAAEATWKVAQATLERRERLALDRYASQQALDDARAAEREARAKLDALRQDLALAVKGSRQEDIAEAKAKLRAAEAELSLARHRLSDTMLHASADGIVLTRIQEPGAVILANSPVYTIALSDPVWVRTYVSEPDLGRIHPGMDAQVTTDSAPDHVYQGWVGFISPTAEFTPKTVQTQDIRTSLVYRLRVYVRNPDRGLRQGMPVTVRLLGDQGGGPAQGAPAAPGD
jgi:HlyD family secretion protein